MSAANVDIIIYDGRNWNAEIVWFDKDDIPVDVTGYGAIIVIKETEDSAKELIRSTHNDDITVGTTNGLFDVSISSIKTRNLGIKRGVWEMVIHPTAADPEANPVTLIIGKVHYHKSYAKLI